MTRLITPQCYMNLIELWTVHVSRVSSARHPLEHILTHHSCTPCSKYLAACAKSAHMDWQPNSCVQECRKEQHDTLHGLAPSQLGGQLGTGQGLSTLAMFDLTVSQLESCVSRASIQHAADCHSLSCSMSCRANPQVCKPTGWSDEFTAIVSDCSCCQYEMLDAASRKQMKLNTLTVRNYA